ncbi:MAG TPA: DUF4442 domain-containing protein [Phototrophicaceae bacterium]|nr:DUF4442 domain-containing protein [Phototrophicaceae bacterium]
MSSLLPALKLEGQIVAESFQSSLARRLFNIFPAYWSTGAVITYISADWRAIKIKLPLKLRTRNYVGTIFGGSIYSAVDPIYMIMLIRLLGSDYVVWDKSASIRFKKPGRSTLYASFKLDDEELATIRQLLTEQPSIDRTYTIELTDKEGVVHATVEKVIYIKLKSPTIQPVVETIGLIK